MSCWARRENGFERKCIMGWHYLLGKYFWTVVQNVWRNFRYLIITNKKNMIQKWYTDVLQKYLSIKLLLKSPQHMCACICYDSICSFLLIFDGLVWFFNPKGFSENVICIKYFIYRKILFFPNIQTPFRMDS